MVSASHYLSPPLSPMNFAQGASPVLVAPGKWPQGGAQGQACMQGGEPLEESARCQARMNN